MLRKCSIVPGVRTVRPCLPELCRHDAQAKASREREEGGETRVAETRTGRKKVEERQMKTH